MLGVPIITVGQLSLLVTNSSVTDYNILSLREIYQTRSQACLDVLFRERLKFCGVEEVVSLAREVDHRDQLRLLDADGDPTDVRLLEKNRSAG